MECVNVYHRDGTMVVFSFTEKYYYESLTQMTSLLSLTQNTTYKWQSVCYITYLKNIIWKLLQKETKVFGFVGTDHLRTKIIINNEKLEQVSQFTYLGYLGYLTHFPMM